MPLTYDRLSSSTSINKLLVMQNAALRTATWCTQDTNIQHLHDETLILPIHEHLQLHAPQYKQKTQHPSHPLHKHTTYFNTPRLKNTIFNNGRYTTNITTLIYYITHNGNKCVHHMNTIICIQVQLEYQWWLSFVKSDSDYTKHYNRHKTGMRHIH